MSFVNLTSAAITVVAGIILLFSLRFFFILHPRKCRGRLMYLLRDRSLKRSFFLALAGTLGVGNIYGVALGIILGGEGSVFWLFISSFFAMAIKYSESAVSVAYGSRGKGMMIPIKSSFGRLGEPIAVFYCVCTLIISLSMGAAVQSDSLITSAAFAINSNKMLAASALLLLALPVISGGGARIKDVTEALIPLATLLYVFLCALAIARNLSGLDEAIRRILSSAFSFRSAAFGVVPFFSLKALGQGFARGLLSNEAGAGSSAMAHSESDVSPADAGVLGIAEIVFDTDILCVLTGLVIIICVDSPSRFSSPMSLVFSAFESGVGDLSLIPLLIIIAIFAYSTVICWYYYGLRAISYIGVERGGFVYCFLFSLSILFPVFIDGSIAVYLSDILLVLMSAPTLICLLKNRKMIIDKSRDSGFLS